MRGHLQRKEMKAAREKDDMERKAAIVIQNMYRAKAARALMAYIRAQMIIQREQAELVLRAMVRGKAERWVDRKMDLMVDFDSFLLYL